MRGSLLASESLLCRHRSRCCCSSALAVPESGLGYLEQLKGISVHSLRSNAYLDTTSFSLIWQNGLSRGIRRAAGLLFTLFAAIGFIRANLLSPTSLGTAMLVYLIAIVIWPSASDPRMIFPLIPGYVYYVIRGMKSPPVASVLAKRGPVALLIVSLGSYATWYSSADFGPFDTGVETSGSRELFTFIREHTMAEDVCIFFKPRALALYTKRKASAYSLGTDQEQFRRYAESIGATIMIIREHALVESDGVLTTEMSLPVNTRDFELVFENAEFRAYRWH